MFDLKIVDIFSTICVGFLTIVLVVFIYFWFNKFFVKDKFDDEVFISWLKGLLKENYSQTWYAIVATVVIYCFGIIAGDLTDRMTDSDDNKNSLLAFLKKASVMETESDLRKEALIRMHSDSSLTSLGRAVFSTKAITTIGNSEAGTDFFSGDKSKNSDSGLKNTEEKWSEIKQQIKSDHSKDSQFKSFVLQIYYTSKNWVYSKQHEPLNELKDIQNRIDLARSIVLLVVSALLIFLAMYVVFLAIYLYKKIYEVHSLKFYKPYRPFLTLIFLLLIARECYHINEINFLKRAYGYYVSHIEQEKIKRDNMGDNKKPIVVNLKVENE